MRRWDSEVGAWKVNYSTGEWAKFTYHSKKSLSVICDGTAGGFPTSEQHIRPDLGELCLGPFSGHFGVHQKRFAGVVWRQEGALRHAKDAK
jgi:hypothetical protein